MTLQSPAISYLGMFLCTEGKGVQQNLHKFWLAQFSSVREGTPEELSHHEGIYNMHKFLAHRTNVKTN